MRPYLMRVAIVYVALALLGVTWSLLVPTVAGDLLGLPRPQPSGSGDTSWHYVHICLDLTLASAGAAVWSALRRPHDALRPLLALAVRAYLFKGMVAYGLMKVFKTQFPEPSLVKLATTFGESSPMGVLWAFMGASTPYCVLTGSIELVGAVLMISRRTTTLGALILLGAMGNVVMLNICYDVPVKQHALHYLAGATFLLAADGRRLARFLIMGRAVEARASPPIFRRPRIHRLGQYAKAVAAASVLLSSVATVMQMRARFIDVEPPPLHGIWEVRGFDAGDAQTDPWTQLVIAKRGRASVRLESGPRLAYKAKTSGGTLVLERRRGTDPKLEFEVGRPTPDRLTLKGQGLSVELRRVDEANLPLRNPTFYWVTDQPRHVWR